MEKTSTLFDETIHITLKCAVHFHGHRNKVVPFTKPSIFADFSNGTKFRNCTCWLTNDTWNHYFLRLVNNHHIDNENKVLLGHVEIGS
jgi:hypothetical protein